MREKRGDNTYSAHARNVMGLCLVFSFIYFFAYDYGPDCAGANTVKLGRIKGAPFVSTCVKNVRVRKAPTKAPFIVSSGPCAECALLFS